MPCNALACLIGLFVVCIDCAEAQENEAVANGITNSREYKLKAAFLYQFSKYIEWPEASYANAQAPFVIGIYGANPFGNATDKIASKKKTGTHPIAFKVLQSVKALNDCHMVFIPSSVPDEDVKAIIDRVRQAKILVVGETAGLIKAGGDIQFFVQENKLRFAINQQLPRRGLRASSKLLALAKPVPQSTDQLPSAVGIND